MGQGVGSLPSTRDTWTEFVRSWLQHGPDQAVVVVWEMNQQMGVSFSLAVSKNK